MGVPWKRFKRNQFFKRIGWMTASVFIYAVFEAMLIRIAISDTRILAVCKTVLDASRIFFAEQLFRLVVIVMAKAEDGRKNDFNSRIRIHFMEVVFVGIFIYSIRFHWNQSPLWIDIAIFILAFAHLLSGNSSYINTLEVMGLNMIRDYSYAIYKDMYETAVHNVEQYNLKEQQLLETRIKYAGNDSDIKKANRDRRSYVVKKKLNPDCYLVPEEPEPTDYTGINGLLYGKRNVCGYQIQVLRYTETLEKAFKDYDRKSRELQARMIDVNDAIRYVEGTEDEHQIEKILGRRIDRSKKVQNSYKKLYRRRFERKNRKY